MAAQVRIVKAITGRRRAQIRRLLRTLQRFGAREAAQPVLGPRVLTNQELQTLVVTLEQRLQAGLQLRAARQVVVQIQGP